ncbi:MAG: hypothetical protein LBJ63_09400 [Prevotellaceae bacterium]|jgi:tRNA A37 methylthiotransferase MiaB|nr:hypothetical protein [Prevotellaceae bacterium]
MNSAYKQFNIDNSAYVFYIEDFEIFKILQGKNIENVLQEIKNEKEKYNPNIEKTEKKSIKDDFIFNSKIINTIGLDIAHGCTLDCTYCYVSASKKP